jgi:hypothetical protein
LVTSEFVAGARHISRTAADELVLYDGREKGKGLFPMQVTQRA